MSKADLLEMLRSRHNMFDTVNYSDIKVNIFNDTAVVTSLFHGKGQELELVQRYMRVYVHRFGEWQCVATQIVPVAT